MVKVFSDSGKSWWHEPPFTAEEEQALTHQINAPPVTCSSEAGLGHPEPPANKAQALSITRVSSSTGAGAALNPSPRGGVLLFVITDCA